MCALSLVPSLVLATGEAGRSTPKRRVTHPPTLQEILASTARRAPAPSSGVSIAIADLETGEPVFEKNAATPETIASVTNTHLAISAVALQIGYISTQMNTVALQMNTVIAKVRSTSSPVGWP